MFSSSIESLLELVPDGLKKHWNFARTCTGCSQERWKLCLNLHRMFSRSIETLLELAPDVLKKNLNFARTCTGCSPEALKLTWTCTECSQEALKLCLNLHRMFSRSIETLLELAPDSTFRNALGTKRHRLWFSTKKV